MAVSSPLARVKIEKLSVERREQFDARTEVMTAEQRLLFADAVTENQASLRAKLAALQDGCRQRHSSGRAGFTAARPC